MATLILGRRPASLFSSINRTSNSLRIRNGLPIQWQRYLQSSTTPKPPASDFAFAFDIDGVLLRSSSALPNARRTLSYLQAQRIPFILLTNGGGKSEAERVHDISKSLDIPLNTDMFVQSHTPFAELVHGDETGADAFGDKCVLVLGGEKDSCRRVAEGYGFTNVLTPSDLITAHPSLMPFAHPSHYAPYARPLPSPHLSPRIYHSSHTYLKIDAIFIFNDPRDWALDAQILLDLLLSHAGYLGSLSPLNGNPSLPNNGYQQDAQPPLFFSNPDLWWAAAYQLPRLGQGGFREAFEGIWRAVTGGASLEKRMFGKPFQSTFAFAERKLIRHRKMLLGDGRTKIGMEGLRTVYMVGDNPESDILGANQFESEEGVEWKGVLVRSGVFGGGEVVHRPEAVVDDVLEAVEWALRREGRGVDDR